MRRRQAWLLRSCLRSCLLSCLLGGTALAGERHALLIGVADLPAMPRSSWLAGPTADVNAMHAALLQQGFADARIQRLADDAGASEAPTRAAVLARLAQLEKTLGKDDLLLLYWSGHSVLLPAYPGQAAAPQGRRTRLLTRDSRVSQQGRQLDGGIASSELGRAIDAFAARQTQVVAIFDTCHAAAGTRSGDGLTWRGLAAPDIGWRPMPGAPAASHDAAAADAPRARPRFVAFYASEAQQRTPEATAAAAPGQAAGLFTQAVIAALQSEPQTYAMWAGAATQQYQSALRAYQLPRSAWPSPVYAGALDAALWQGGATGAAPLWPVQRDARGWQVPYGLLDGIREGDLFRHAGTRWRAATVGWGETRLALLPGDGGDSAAPGWASRTPAPLPASAARHGGQRLATLLALPATPGQPLLDARIELTLPGKAPRQLAFTDGDLGVLPAGTRIGLSVENRGAASVDLGLAHLPLDGPAARLYPALDGDSNRMPPAIGAGISRFERSFVVSGPRFGVEWLALVAAPAANGAPQRRFAILDTLPGLASTRGGAAPSPAAALPQAGASHADQAQVARLSWRSVQ